MRAAKLAVGPRSTRSQVGRQGVRAGVDSYSLKDVEKLFFTRRAEVSSGNEAVIEFERWLDDRDPARLDAIAAYITRL